MNQKAVKMGFFCVEIEQLRRTIVPPKRFGQEDVGAYALNTAISYDVDEPKSYKEVISSKDHGKWEIAMKEEMESLYKNQTWKLVKKPPHTKLVGWKWIYKKKEGNSN